MKEISLNFGAIRDSISRLSTQEIIKESKSNTLKSFMTEVKKNPVLFKQHIIFKNIEDCKPFEKERLAERFLNQNLSLLKGVKWQDIMSENKKIRISLLENSHVESNAGKKDDLFNSIHTLIESATKPTFTNFENEQKAYDFIIEHLTRKESQEKISKEKNDNPNLFNWQFITKLAVNNFNERFSHLKENEKKILNIMLSDDNKKANYIEDIKKENIEIINKLLKETKEKERITILENFKEKLNSDYKYDTFTADDFLISFYELNENLKNL